MMNLKRWYILLFLFLLGLSVSGESLMALEQPNYAVIEKEGDIRYESPAHIVKRV